jgi:quinol-cytochrome oxidoreductase complex cytochrome b subunit
VNLRQKIFLGIVVVANATAWIMQSDVAKLVARDRPVLLGRYSRSHFTAILVIFLISVIGLYIDQARTRETYKRRWFQVIATLLFLIPGFFCSTSVCVSWCSPPMSTTPAPITGPPAPPSSSSLSMRPKPAC